MGNSNSPSVAEVESAPTDIPPEVILPKSEGKEITNDELARLRDILFGSQSRTLDKRLGSLEADLKGSYEAVTTRLHDQIGRLSDSTSSQFTELRREFTGKLEQQGSDQTAHTRATHKDLTDRLDRQAAEQTAQLQAAQKQMNDGLENFATDLLRQIRETHRELSDRIDKLATEQAERVRSLQVETRQRDDSLRQELLAMASALEGKKASRQDLGQMLMELGLRLRQDPEKF
jgi:uncharacterized phage infection (PIP) family protein YhgE